VKIVVIGGSGLIGSKLVTKLCAWGHETLAASPKSGVNTLTGEGLATALDGAWWSSTERLLPGADAILGETRYGGWPGRTWSGK